MIFILVSATTVLAVKKPSMITLEPEDVHHNTALLRGELLDIGGYDDVDVYFQYREGTTGSFEETTKRTRSAEGIFQARATDLKQNTYYEYRAVSEYNGSTIEGALRSFETGMSPTVFTIDYSEPMAIVVVVLLFIISALFIFLGYPAISSLIVTVTGFTFLSSGVNTIFSAFVIIVGILIAFLKGGYK